MENVQGRGGHGAGERGDAALGKPRRDEVPGRFMMQIRSHREGIDHPAVVENSPAADGSR